MYNCEKFLERYPTGKYTNEVKDIRDRLAYESIGENIVQLQEYVKKYPNSKYVPDAKVRIEQFNLPVFTVSQAKQIARHSYLARRYWRFSLSRIQQGETTKLSAWRTV